MQSPTPVQSSSSPNLSSSSAASPISSTSSTALSTAQTALLLSKSSSKRKKGGWRKGLLNAESIRQSMSVQSTSTHLILEIVSKFDKSKECWVPVEHSKTIPFFVGNSGAVIGRNISSAQDDRGQIVISDDAGMSRNHAEIQFDYQNKKFELRDLGGSNNTVIVTGKILDGTKEIVIENKAIGQKGTQGKWFPLVEGTIFQLGGSRLKVTRVVVTSLQTKLEDPFAKTRQEAGAKRAQLKAEETVVMTEAEQFASMWVEEPKRITVLLRHNATQKVIGITLVEPAFNFGQVKRNIFQNLILSRTQSITLKVDQMSLFLNGTIPISALQDNENAYKCLNLGGNDKLVVEFTLT